MRISEKIFKRFYVISVTRPIPLPSPSLFREVPYWYVSLLTHVDVIRLSCRHQNKRFPIPGEEKYCANRTWETERKMKSLNEERKEWLTFFTFVSNPRHSARTSKSFSFHFKQARTAIEATSHETALNKNERTIRSLS